MDSELLVALMKSDCIEPEEIAFLLTLKSAPKQVKKKFDLDDLSDTDCKEFFRFEKEDLPRLQKALHIPREFRTANGSVFSGIEGLCVLLRRLAYPNRYTDIKHLFSRSRWELSLEFSWILDHVYDHFSWLLSDLNLWWVTLEDMYEFAPVIRERGAPLENCWAFIDGTVRPICRPKYDQKVVWNAHYRTHSLVFQSVVPPNGMVVNLDGPWPGRRHDAGILAESGLIAKLQTKMDDIGDLFTLYGDPAYPVSRFLDAPFRKVAGELTEDQLDFNTDMSACRICVEWAFGKIVKEFAFVDFQKNLRVLLQPVGKYYIVAALLANCHTTLYGSQTGTFFGLSAPDLEEYLENRKIRNVLCLHCRVVHGNVTDCALYF